MYGMGEFGWNHCKIIETIDYLIDTRSTQLNTLHL